MAGHKNAGAVLTSRTITAMKLSKSNQSPFQNPEAFVTKILWKTVGGFAGVSLILYFAVGSDSPAWRVPLALGFLIMMAASYCHFVIVPNSGKFLDAISQGDYLAHWTYTDDEWRQWEQASPRKPRDPSARDAYLSADAIYFEGIFNCWSLTYNHWLEEVSIEESPMPSVCVTYSCIFGNCLGSSLRTVHIPIPEGRYEEAAQVVATLRQKVSLDCLETTSSAPVA